MNTIKACARWILRVLTEDENGHLQQFPEMEMEVNSLLDRIVSTDKSMFNVFDRETKMESSV